MGSILSRHDSVNDSGNDDSSSSTPPTTESKSNSVVHRPEVVAVIPKKDFATCIGEILETSRRLRDQGSVFLQRLTEELGESTDESTEMANKGSQESLKSTQSMDLIKEKKNLGRISEELERCLIRFDSLEPETEEQRLQRKEGVLEVQKLLKGLDHMKDRLEKMIPPPAAPKETPPTSEEKPIEQ